MCQCIVAHVHSTGCVQSANDAEVNMFCLRCMVGTAILYDHMHPQGVFRKGSDVNMKQCIGTLKAQEGEEKNALLNVLRFTSAHLNDPEVSCGTLQAA